MDAQELMNTIINQQGERIKKLESDLALHQMVMAVLLGRVGKYQEASWEELDSLEEDKDQRLVVGTDKKGAYAYLATKMTKEEMDDVTWSGKWDGH